MTVTEVDSVGKTKYVSAMIQDIDKRIASLEEIMDLKEERSGGNYTNLETYLSNMQSQSNWLAGRLLLLPNKVLPGVDKDECLYECSSIL
jgi:flagellar capping protein FliD